MNKRWILYFCMIIFWVAVVYKIDTIFAEPRTDSLEVATIAPT